MNQRLLCAVSFALGILRPCLAIGQSSAPVQPYVSVGTSHGRGGEFWDRNRVAPRGSVDSVDGRDGDYLRLSGRGATHAAPNILRATSMVMNRGGTRRDRGENASIL